MTHASIYQPSTREARNLLSFHSMEKRDDFWREAHANERHAIEQNLESSSRHEPLRRRLLDAPGDYAEDPNRRHRITGLRGVKMDVFGR
jgi:hypothetical protein